LDPTGYTDIGNFPRRTRELPAARHETPLPTRQPVNHRRSDLAVRNQRFPREVAIVRIAVHQHHRRPLAVHASSDLGAVGGDGPVDAVIGHGARPCDSKKAMSSLARGSGATTGAK
jgi:hypothetical protein